MKKLKLIGIISTTLILLTMLCAFTNEKSCVSDRPTPAPRNAGSTVDRLSRGMRGQPSTKLGFAVLELFTSEGCSSCPPADEVFAEIEKEYQNKPVYLLAYHVDYWDNLGWKDSFSNAEYSKRQAQYGKWLQASQIYTPQLIINGEKQMVGSNESLIKETLIEELSMKTESNLKVQAHKENDRLILNYQLAKPVNGADLLIAIIQKSAESKVQRGENAGHILKHVQIVRQLQKVPVDKAEGVTEIGLPKDFSKDKYEILALVQDQKKGSIISATNVGLN